MSLELPFLQAFKGMVYISTNNALHLAASACGFLQASVQSLLALNVKTQWAVIPRKYSMEGEHDEGEKTDKRVRG